MPHNPGKPDPHPITVQQFDFVAETLGIAAALAAAEEAGGVTGTRDKPTQMVLPGEGVETPTGMGSGWGGGLTTGGGFMPGTLATDVSRGIGEAGTQASGMLNLMGGGGGGVATAGQQQSLADLLALGAQGDPSANLPNAPLGGATALAALPTFDQQILARAQAGEFLTIAELSQMAPGEMQNNAVRAVLSNWIREQGNLAEAGDGDGIKNSFKTIYDLWQNFFPMYEITVFMNDLAQQGGLGENHFAGMERALETAGEEFDWTGTRGGNITGAFAQGQRDNVSEYILGYAGQTNDWTKAITAAARNAFQKQGDSQWQSFAGNNNIPEFASERDAYAFFVGFYSDNPDYWTAEVLGTEDLLPSYITSAEGAEGAAGAADVTGAALAGAAGTVPIAGSDLGGLGAAGLGAEQRGFGDVFPGFVSTSPWAGIPNVGSAIAGAAPFFESQFGMVSPFIPETAIPAGESRAGNWLRGLSTGATGLLRGNPLAERLQAIGAALQGPMAGTLGEGGVGAGDLLRGAYFDPKSSAPGSQVGAIQNPFILATRGAPTSRALVMRAIQKAATDFAYKYPSGIPVAEGTAPEQFLPYALRTNLMGIQDLPEFQGMNWANI